MESLLTLATKYATRHGTKILSYRITADQITFILEAGPKLTKTVAELSADSPNTETPESPVLIDPSDGVDETEASAAGSALAKRRGRKARNLSSGL
jgi:hypothetical protein